MTIDDKIKDEILKYGINREAAKRALSSGKVYRYEFLTGEELLPCDQSRIIKQAKLHILLVVKYLKKK